MYKCISAYNNTGAVEIACQSMIRKGNCLDNVCAESFFKTLKVELNLSKRRFTVK